MKTGKQQVLANSVAQMAQKEVCHTLKVFLLKFAMKMPQKEVLALSEGKTILKNVWLPPKCFG